MKILTLIVAPDARLHGSTSWHDKQTTSAVESADEGQSRGARALKQELIGASFEVSFGEESAQKTDPRRFDLSMISA